MKKPILFLLLHAAVCLHCLQTAAYTATCHLPGYELFDFPAPESRPTINSFDQLSGGDSLTIALTQDTSWYMIAAPSSMLSYGQWLQNLVTQGFEGSDYPDRQPNILWFDETDTLTSLMSWRAPISENDIVAQGRGHYFFVFGNIPQDSLYNDQLPVYLSVAAEDAYSDGNFAWDSFSFPVTFTPRTGMDNTVGGQNNIYTETNLVNEGWNLLGNPTSLTLDWGSASGWTKVNIDSAIYIWNAAEKTFDFYNGITGTHSGLIPPFQAFWIRANGPEPQLSFTEDAISEGGEFQKPDGYSRTVSNTDELHLVIQLAGNNLQTQCMISWSESGKTGHDAADAFRLEPLNNNHLDVYTLSSPDHTVPLALNHLPRLGKDFYNIPLFPFSIQNRKAQNGLLTLEWQLPDNWPDNWAISLHDHSLQKAINMHDQSQYTFYSNPDWGWYYSGRSSPAESSGLFSLVADPGVHIRQTKEPFSIIIQKGNMLPQPTYIKPVPALLPNYPNPFTENTNLSFTLPEAHFVTLEIYDFYGKRIYHLLQGEYPPGVHSVQWNSSGLPAGIYLLRLTTSVNQDVIKLHIGHH